MTEALRQLESLSQNLPTGEDARRALYQAAQKLMLSLETPRETLIRLLATPLELTAAVIACDLGIFEQLTDKSPATTVELAKIANADELLTQRILQFLASMHMVEEVSAGTFAATNISRTLSEPGFKAGVYHNFYAVTPAIMELPKHLKQRNHRNPADAYDTAFQLAFNTDLLTYAYVATRPDLLQNAMTYMTSWHSGKPSWLDSFSPEGYWEGATAETLLFVDIGGGVGPQAVGLKQRFPDVAGRIVVQDLPEVVIHGIPSPGVEHIAHDFWTPQPLKGARIYYMRTILHDYPDDKCLEILKNIIPAMTKDSVILLDEMVLPAKRVTHGQAQMDLSMMACFASLERNHDQWRELLLNAGLQIDKTVTYSKEMDESIIVATPLER